MPILGEADPWTLYIVLQVQIKISEIGSDSDRRSTVICKKQTRAEVKTKINNKQGKTQADLFKRGYDS